MKVLIVEDSMTSALLLLTLVERLEGFSAVCASTGAEAMDLAGRERFDVVLMDYMLPDDNGLDLSHRIRAVPHNRSAVVVMITSSYERNLRLACLDSGIDEFLNKPVDVAELRLRLLNIATLARMRRTTDRTLADVLGRLEERLSLPAGTLDPVRLATLRLVADTPAWDGADAVEVRELAAAWTELAAVAERVGPAGGPAGRRFENLDEIVLPSKSH